MKLYGFYLTLTVAIAQATLLPAIRFAAIPGDADSNGTVEFDDFLTLSANWGATGATWAMGNF